MLTRSMDTKAESFESSLSVTQHPAPLEGANSELGLQEERLSPVAN